MDSAARPGYSVVPELSATTVRIAKDAPVALTATNTYSRDTGGFSVSKRVTGDDDFAGEAFSIAYQCSPPDGGTEAGALEVTAGATVDGPRLLVGECRLSERAAEVDGTDLSTTIAVDGGDPVAGGRAMAALTEGGSAKVELANTYTRHTGTFAVAKSAAGAEAQVEGKEFSFSYTCTDGTMGSLQARADGMAVAAGQQWAVGTECTITEDTGSAQIEGFTLTAPESQTITVARDGEGDPVAFTNRYQRRDPQPDPDVTEKPGEPGPGATEAPTPQTTSTGVTDSCSFDSNRGRILEVLSILRSQLCKYWLRDGNDGVIAAGDSIPSNQRNRPVPSGRPGLPQEFSGWCSHGFPRRCAPLVRQGAGGGVGSRFGVARTGPGPRPANSPLRLASAGPSTSGWGALILLIRVAASSGSEAAVSSSLSSLVWAGAPEPEQPRPHRREAATNCPGGGGAARALPCAPPR